MQPMPTGLPIKRQATPAPEADNSWVLAIVVLLGAVLLAVIGWIINKLHICRTLPSIRRHYARYDYTALEDEQSNQEKMELEKKQRRGTARGNALLTCQYYLRTSGRYSYLDQFNDIGSRIDKYWFMVRDSALKTDRMMTMVPYNDYAPMGLNGSTKKILSELFLALQHPYIYPILDVDFKTMAEETFVIIIFPFNCHGSLKDLIYRSNCRDDWQEKYGHRSIGLPEAQIQRIGRQILEALLFLQDKGFPSFSHLHSGNVMMQNGVARLTGLENTILGYTSRIYPMLKKRLRDCRDAIDTVCFGHILFEMAAAYELNVAHPTTKDLQDIQSHSQILQVLNFIFEREDGQYPTIEELALLDFFRNLDLREMRGTTSPPVFQTKLSQSVKTLLREVRRHQRCQKPSKRSHSTSSLETPSRESKSFPGSDLLDCCEASGIHRHLSASSSTAVNRLATLENGDVRRYMSAASVLTPAGHRSEFTDRPTRSSGPYGSFQLDASCHLAAPSGSEEYHTPPTTPTVKSELDLTAALKEPVVTTTTPINLLQQCFQRIQDTFEGAVSKVASRDSII